jgi:hypothetical protein
LVFILGDGPWFLFWGTVLGFYFGGRSLVFILGDNIKKADSTNLLFSFRP